MNSKKKIIDTLRSADKASVEKLMAEEAKKNEIFAKAAERAGKSAETGFADTVSGVEHYDRRISMKRMASIAAAAVLMAGGVLGGMHLMKNGGFDNNHGGSSEYATDVTETTAETSTEAVTTTVTTSAVNAVEPVTVPVTTEPHDDVPEVLTGEWLRERCLNATHYYDKFSADIHSFHATYGQNLGDWETNGTVKIDNTAMNGEMYEDMSSPEREVWDRTYNILLNNIYVYINQNDIAAQNDNNEGKYCYITSADKEYETRRYEKVPDRVLIGNCGAFSYIELDNGRTYTAEGENGSETIDSIANETEWTITGERYENGRRIASVSFYYEQLREGIYEPRYITADIDAETGVWFAYEIRTDNENYGNGYLIESFKATNYKFDDEAEAPMTAAEVREFLESNGYDEYNSSNSEYKVENIG